MASEKILKFVEEVKTLTVLELNELVKGWQGLRQTRFLHRQQQRHPQPGQPS
mgnify:CR=1 FL=1